MKFAQIASVITVAVKKNQKFLLLRGNKKDVWGFPSEGFDDNLNGNLDGTVKRMLKTITDLHQNIDYLGSFLREEGSHILIGYNFLIENFEGKIFEHQKWVAKDEIASIELDKNTSTFLKLHKDLI